MAHAEQLPFRDTPSQKQVPVGECLRNPSQSFDWKLESELQPFILDHISSFKDRMGASMTESDARGFQKVLKDALPVAVYEKIANLTKEDIVLIMTAIIGISILLMTGVAIIPACASIAGRIGLSNVMSRILVTCLSDARASSVVMGIIPGMKMYAPNLNISLATNAMKDFILYGLPTLISQMASGTGKMAQGAR